MTDQDLDEAFGTDTPHHPLVSHVDAERDEMREEGSWDGDGIAAFFENSYPEENDPSKISLMDVHDFHDVEEPPANSTPTDIKVMPGQDGNAVIRNSYDTGASLLLKILIPLWLLVLGGIWFVYEKEINETWSLGEAISSSIRTALNQTEEPGQGLSHQDVRPHREVRNGIDYLVVEGIVANTVGTAVMVPVLKATLTNAEGKEIRVQTVDLGKDQLGPGETVPFKVEFENPPGTARSLALGFLSAEEMAASEMR